MEEVFSSLLQATTVVLLLAIGEHTVTIGHPRTTIVLMHTACSSLAVMLVRRAASIVTTGLLSVLFNELVYPNSTKQLILSFHTYRPHKRARVCGERMNK